ADRAIRLGEAQFVVAGGIESMTNDPHVIRDLRWGVRIGASNVVDVMQHDGLFCAFDQCTMGESSDLKNERLGITREEQDEWAVMSPLRGEGGTGSGDFGKEIVAVEGPDSPVDRYEGIGPGASIESVSQLRPALSAGGTNTAANASLFSDGAAA